MRSRSRSTTWRSCPCSWPVDRFHRRFDHLYGYSMPWKAVEFLTFHLKSSATREPPFELAPEPDDAVTTVDDAVRGSRSCMLDGVPAVVPVYDAARLVPGHILHGPVLIDDVTTTILVLDDYSCVVDLYGNYVMTPDRAAGMQLAEAATRATASEDL